jgi:hypothetical protein
MGLPSGSEQSVRFRGKVWACPLESVSRGIRSTGHLPWHHVPARYLRVVVLPEKGHERMPSGPRPCSPSCLMPLDFRVLACHAILQQKPDTWSREDGPQRFTRRCRPIR